MDFNIWKMLSTQGNQTNPLVLNQMADQGAGDQQWHAPMLPPQMPDQAPPIPPITPVNNTLPPQSTMPTSGAPLGTTPQETRPAGPPPTFQRQDSPNMDYAQMLLRLKGQPINQDERDERANAERTYSAMMSKQQADVDRLRELSQQYADKPDRFDFRPAAAFVDSMNPGSNFSKAAEEMAPESAEAKLAKQEEMQKTITAAQAGITKDQYDYIKTKLQQMGYDASRMTKRDVATLAAAGKLAGVEATQQGTQARIAQTAATQGARIDQANQRISNNLDKEARGTVNNDPMLKIYGPRLEGAAKIGELIQSAREGKVVSNQALLGQINAEVARLETGSQSPGLGQGEKTEINDNLAQLHAMADAVTGNPTDAVRPEILNTQDKMVKELSGSYMRGVDSRMDFLRSGMKPQQQNIVDQKHESIKSTYAPRFGGWNGIEQTKVWNGKTYKMEGDHWVEQ